MGFKNGPRKVKIMPVCLSVSAPAHLTQHQHRAAARRSSPPHDDPSATGRAPRHTGPVSAHRRDGMFRAPICERDWRPSCVVRRSSSVVSGQWCTHFDARDNRRLVAIKTAFARWRNPDELRGSLQHADETTKLHPISKIWLAKWLPAANMAAALPPPPQVLITLDCV